MGRIGYCTVRSVRIGLRGRKEDQHGQLFGNVVETMLDIFSHEENVAGKDFAVFVASPKMGAAAYDVVHLIFTMRTLCVSGSDREHVETGAHRRHPQKFA